MKLWIDLCETSGRWSLHRDKLTGVCDGSKKNAGFMVIQFFALACTAENTEGIQAITLSICRSRQVVLHHKSTTSWLEVVTTLLAVNTPVWPRPLNRAPRCSQDCVLGSCVEPTRSFARWGNPTPAGRVLTPLEVASSVTDAGHNDSSHQNPWHSFTSSHILTTWNWSSD